MNHILVFNKHILYVFILVFCFSSCTPKKVHFTNILFDQALKQAKQENKYLCIVSSRNDCGYCNRFNKTFSSYTFDKQINDGFIFCQLDELVHGNAFFNRVFYNYAYPSTYIFTPNGKLITLFPGPKEKEDLEKLLLTCLQGIDRLGPYVVSLKTKDSRVADLFYDTYQAYRICSLYANSKDSLLKAEQYIEQSLAIEPYFYNTYLAAKINEISGEHEKACSYAKEALLYHSQQDLYLYSSLHNELKQIINPNYDARKDAYITISKNVHDYGKVVPQSRNECLFSVKNTGASPLIIYEVKGSCGCTESDWTKKPILPGEVGIIKITYKAIDHGCFTKMVTVYTNASNPLLRLKITGIVQNNI